MRRGELLNTTWSDIDFDAKTIKVAPKRDTDETWEWNIKDTDRRLLPLTNEIIHLLAEHQGEQSSGYPYVFIPPKRYDRIQKKRAEGKWTIRDGLYPLNNFDKQFSLILERAGVDEGEFHDFRRTCISNWLENGMKEYEVMRLVGHASFATTHKFYLAVSKRLISCAREASKQVLGTDFVAHLLRAPLSA